MDYNLARLQEQFQTVKNDFFDCKNKLVKAAQTLGVAPENPDKVVSLTELELLLSTVKKAEEERNRAIQVRQRALIILDRVLSVFHRDNSNFKPLLECKEKAGKLRRQISESVEVKADPESEALVEGNHAFSQVLKLIEGVGELDDDRLTELQDAVAQHFKRSLATAALRGKLAFGTTAAPVVKNVSAKLEVEDTEKAIAPPPVVPPVAPPIPPETMEETEDESPPWELPEEEAGEPPMLEPPVVEPPMVPPPVAPPTLKNSQGQSEEEAPEAPVVAPPVVEPPVVSQTRENGVVSKQELVGLNGNKNYQK
jgi:hypothetical protein